MLAVGPYHKLNNPIQAKRRLEWGTLQRVLGLLRAFGVYVDGVEELADEWPILPRLCFSFLVRKLARPSLLFFQRTQGWCTLCLGDVSKISNKGSLGHRQERLPRGLKPHPFGLSMQVLRLRSGQALKPCPDTTLEHRTGGDARASIKPQGRLLKPCSDTTLGESLADLHGEHGDEPSIDAFDWKREDFAGLPGYETRRAACFI